MTFRKGVLVLERDHDSQKMHYFSENHLNFHVYIRQTCYIVMMAKECFTEIEEKKNYFIFKK